MLCRRAQRRRAITTAAATSSPTWTRSFHAATSTTTNDDDFGVKRWQRPWRRDTNDAVVRGGGVRATDGSEMARGGGGGPCHCELGGMVVVVNAHPRLPLMEEDGDGDGDECVRRDDEYFGRLLGGKSIEHDLYVCINNGEACLRT